MAGSGDPDRADGGVRGHPEVREDEGRQPASSGRSLDPALHWGGTASGTPCGPRLDDKVGKKPEPSPRTDPWPRAVARGTSFFPATNAEGRRLASAQPLVSEGPCFHVWALTAPRRGPRPAACGGSGAPPPAVLATSPPFRILILLNRYRKDLHLSRCSRQSSRSNPSPEGPDGI